jgi:hypothetical protein
VVSCESVPEAASKRKSPLSGLLLEAKERNTTREPFALIVGASELRRDNPGSARTSVICVVEQTVLGLVTSAPKAGTAKSPVSVKATQSLTP